MGTINHSTAATRRPQGGILVGIILALLLVTPASTAQTADDALRFSQRHPAAGSAHLAGMGVRGIGGIGVSGALHANPAGLGYVTASSFSLSLSSLDTQTEASSASPGFRSEPWSRDTRFSRLGTLSYVRDVPVQQGSLVFGGSIAQVHSFNRVMEFDGLQSNSTISTSFLPHEDEYGLTEDGNLGELNDLPFAAFNAGIIEFFPSFLIDGGYPFLEAVIPGTVIEQRGEVTDAGDLYEGSVGLAVEAAPDLMVGLSASLLFGRYDYNSQLEEIDAFDQNGFEDYNVLEDDGNLLEGFDRLTYAQRLQSDLVGFNLRLGVTRQITSNLRLGAVVESPTWKYIEESYGASYTTEFDDGGVLTYGNRPDDVGNGFFEYDFRTPWRVGLGLHANFGSVLLATDLEFVDWRQMRFSSPSESGVFDEVNRQIESQYQSTVNFNIGVEVDLGFVTLRGGAAQQPDPLKQRAVTSSGAQLLADLDLYTFGLSFGISHRLRLDLAFQREERNDTWFAYPEDELGRRQDGMLQLDESLTREWMFLELTYRL